MANFYKSGFLFITVNKQRYNNQPVNIDKITRIRIYDRKVGNNKNEEDDYRIYFEGESQVCWMYDTIEKRNYEYEALLGNMNSVTRPSYDFQTYLERIEEERIAKAATNEEVLDETIERKEVFIYRKDKDFFVTTDENQVKRENTHYEKGVLV